jgi:GAF domain-containing protein
MKTIDGVREATPPDDEVKKTWGQAIRYIVGRKRAEEALGLLAAAGTALSATPDREASTQAVANYVVPYLADWCRIDRLDENGSPRTIAVARAAKLPPAMAAAFDEFVDRPDRSWSSRIGRVRDSRKPFLYSPASTGHQDPAGTNGAAPTAGTNGAAPTAGTNGAGPKAGLPGVGTAMIVPIEEGGRLLGTICCATAGVRKTGTYGPADLALLTEIARRVADALVIAELTRTVAQLRLELARGAGTPLGASREGMG